MALLSKETRRTLRTYLTTADSWIGESKVSFQEKDYEEAIFKLLQAIDNIVGALMGILKELEKDG